MGAKRPVAPDTPVRSFPTPNIDDLVVLVDVDPRLPGYKALEYGTPHPDQTRFPGAKLVYQEPLENSDQFVRRIYATDRAEQDAHNYAIKFSGGSPGHPIYIRSYVQLRESYAPLPDGSKDPQDDRAYIVEEETAPLEGELNSLYIRVTRIFETLPGPVITSFSTNEVGQKVTVTTQRKSAPGYTLPAASALFSPSAQSEDTGVVTEQIQSIPGVFTRKQFSSERPDMLPQKFRAAVPDIETSELVEGEAEQPELDQGDISASQTQQTLFLKQVAKRSRQAPEYPVVITETTATRTGQLATVTSTLDDGPQTADTGPLIESSEVTDLGDGRSIKVTTEVDEVFGQRSYTNSREDLVPNKFRAGTIEETSEKTIVLGLDPVSGVTHQDAGFTTLLPEELEHTEQQVTVDTKRVRSRSRSQTVPKTLTGGKQYTSELGGGYATVVETYSTTPDTIQTTEGFGVLSDAIESTGDGFVRRKVTLDPTSFDLGEFDEDGKPLTATTLPPLRGQDYDEELDLTIPYTQVVARPTTTEVVEGPRRRSTPRDKDHTTVIKYDVQDVQKSLDEYFWKIPDMVPIRLPDKLLKANVVYDRGGGQGTGSGFGNTYFFNKSGNSSIRGKIAYDIEEGFSGNIPAFRAVFFLPKESSLPSDVLNKVKSKVPSVIGFYPNARPQAHELLVFGRSMRFEESVSVSFDSGSTSSSKQADISVDFTAIPATIHPQLHIGANIDGGSESGSLLVSPNVLPPTAPYAEFPTGLFVFQVNAAPYKFSYVRVEAIIVEITSEYV